MRFASEFWVGEFKTFPEFVPLELPCVKFQAERRVGENDPRTALATPGRVAIECYGRQAERGFFKIPVCATQKRVSSFSLRNQFSRGVFFR